MINRKCEFDDLKQKMTTSSTQQLESVEAKLNKRIRKYRIKVAVLIPLTVMFIFMCTFVSLINLSPTFVYACSKLPIISELANAVCVSESIKSMVNSEYGIKLDVNKSVDGIKVDMDQYVICNNNIYILVSVKTEEDMNLSCSTKIKLPNGEVINEGMIFLTTQNNQGYFKVSLENDIYNIYDVKSKENYNDENMLKLDINFEFLKIEDKEYYYSKGIYDNINEGCENSISVNLPLKLDMTKNIVDNEVIYLSKAVEIDNQILNFSNINLSPAYISIDVFESESNTKYLDQLLIYVKNSEGKVFKTRPYETYLLQYNGRQKKQTYYLETPYFDNNEKLDIYIAKASFLSKDYQRAYIDLNNIENSNIPKDAELIAAKKNNDKISLSLKFRNHSLQLHRCFDENNNEYVVKTVSVDGNNYTESTRELEISNFTGNMIYFDLFNDTVIEFDEPLQINIR